MDSRERLIESARELLWERGYAATSPQAILREAGVGQGSMYHHFSGKAELAATALERNADENRRNTRVFDDGASAPLDAVVAYLRTPRPALRGCNLGRMTQDPDVLADDRMRSPITETLTWYRVQLALLLGTAQRAGSIRADVDIEAVAAAVVAIVQGAYVLARADQSEGSYQRAVEGGVQLVLALRTD